MSQMGRWGTIHTLYGATHTFVAAARKIIGQNFGSRAFNPASMAALMRYE
jgi:hypothetical protein